MLGFAGSSMAVFAIVWSLLCMVSGVLVTDAMLRDSRVSPMVDVEPASDAPAERPVRG